VEKKKADFRASSSFIRWAIKMSTHDNPSAPGASGFGKKPNLTDQMRESILQKLLAKSTNGVLFHGAIKEVSEEFE